MTSNRPDVKTELKGIFKAVVDGKSYEPGQSAQPSKKETPARTADDYIIQRLVEEQSKPREKKPWWKKFTRGNSSFRTDTGYVQPVGYSND